MSFDRKWFEFNKTFLDISKPSTIGALVKKFDECSYLYMDELIIPKNAAFGGYYPKTYDEDAYELLDEFNQ